jgi:hypothetical protein
MLSVSWCHAPRTDTHMSKTFILLIIFVGVIATVDPLLAADPKPPTISFVDPTLRLDGGAPEGTMKLLVKVDGLSPETLQLSNAFTAPVDLGIPTPPAITVTFSILNEGPPGSSSRMWYVAAAVSGVPGNTNQKRFARVKFDKIESILEYTLTNQYPTAFSWTLKPPPAAWSIAKQRAVPIGIAVGPVPATGVKLSASNIIEQATKVPLGVNDLRLCRNADGDCDTNLSLDANSPNPLFLRVEETFNQPGSFQGTLTIAASQKPEGDTLNVTIYQTSTTRRFWGIVAILAGVLAAWLVTVYGRNRLARDQLLAPAALIREKLLELQKTLHTAPMQFKSDTHQTGTKIDGLLDKLTERSLDSKNYLPPRVPMPYTSTLQAEAYKTFLESLNDPVLLLTALAKEGMVPAWAQFKPGMTSAAQSAIATAVSTVDALASVTPTPSVSQAQVQIQAALRRLDQELHASAQPAALAASSVRDAESPLTYNQIRMEIERISWSVWGVWLFLTCIVGSYLLVFQNLGFGNASDYVLCLLWGFGLPTAGQQLTQLTSSSATTALGISIAR